MNDCSYNSQYFGVEDNQSTDAENIIDLIQSDHEENSVKEQDEPLWSIDDDTFFHPLGLINHGTDIKSVFVTWSENYLLNFVFKKSQKTQRTNLTKVRLDVHGEEIRQILILELNTLLLMQSGRVFHFSSVKSMHPVKWLCRVRCLSTSQLGFSLIRLLPDNTLRLEVYQDVTNIDRSESTMKQSYDITFDDENIFNCNWQDDRFTLLSQLVDKTNFEFLEHLTGKVNKLQNKQEIHFFTVSGSIFALIPEDDPNDEKYHIQLCATYASYVEFMKILCERRLCIIFLQSGSIDIWYISKITQGLRKIPYCTGAQFVHYEFANNGCFYYTDSEKVVQLKFDYEQNLDTCVVQENSKDVYGIQAVTWMENIQQLICLSCNNIFYQLSFDGNADDVEQVKCDNFADLYELTPTKMTRLLAKAHILNELQSAPAEIHKAIEREYVKQELIAVGTKTNIYSKLCAASLEFRLFVPKLDEDVIMIYAKNNFVLNCKSLFALIFIKVEKHVIFAGTTLWQLHINYDDGNCHILSITHDMLRKSLCVVIPLHWQNQSLLPEFQIMLNAFINNEQEFAAISIPINVNKPFNCYKHLFTSRQRTYTNFAEQSLSNLATTYTKQPMKEKPLTTNKLTLTKECNFTDIIKLFYPRRSNSIVLVETHDLSLHFISHTLKIVHLLEENCISLEAADATILYYTKYYMLSNFKSLRRVYLDVSSKFDAKLKSITQYQAEIERCYGLNMNGVDEVTSTLHLQTMKSIYTKIRKELYKPNS